jgi:hypothetical protein
MQQSFEYYIVDPGTWKDVRLINNVKSSTISRDSTAETLGSATIDVDEAMDECYIRIYLVTVQNGVKEKHPLGTFLVQTPSTEFDGKSRQVSMDAYTPLIELKENFPPLGYSVLKNENIMSLAYRLCRDHARAPVVEADCSNTLYDDFVAYTDDTWLSFVTDLIANADYTFGLDELGRIIFMPKQDAVSLQPVWTFTDDNSSILYPSISMDRDMFGIPNVVEVIYSNGRETYYARAVNDDPDSPVSTVRRGREIAYRVTEPNIIGTPTNKQMQNYADQVLREMSTFESTVSFTHGYCPVRPGDCVRLNYTRAGIVDVKAKIISQNIKCEAGCQVTAKAAFITKLWG